MDELDRYKQSVREIVETTDFPEAECGAPGERIESLSAMKKEMERRILAMNGKSQISDFVMGALALAKINILLERARTVQ